MARQRLTAEAWLMLALFIVIAVVLGAAAHSDRHHAQLQHEHHCRMVQAGHWPDFDGRVARGECAQVAQFGPEARHPASPK